MDRAPRTVSPFTSPSRPRHTGELTLEDLLLHGLTVMPDEGPVLDILASCVETVRGWQAANDGKSGVLTIGSVEAELLIHRIEVATALLRRGICGYEKEFAPAPKGGR